MDKYELMNKFRTTIDKYIKYKYQLRINFYFSQNNTDKSLNYLFGDRDNIMQYANLVEKDFKKYLNIFLKAYNQNNYRKAYRVCKYIRKMTKNM